MGILCSKLLKYIISINKPNLYVKMESKIWEVFSINGKLIVKTLQECDKKPELRVSDNYF